jgi:ABC-type dipeptide/oligopeptide/nickel transport system ATPase subunit
LGHELLRIHNVEKAFDEGHTPVLNGVDLIVETGAILGLVGETGHGKTTLARIIIGLENPDRGEVVFRGEVLPGLAKRTLNDCTSIQYVFQDPYAAIENESTIEQVLKEAVRLCRGRSKEYVLSPADAMASVGLGEYNNWRKRKVSSLSGGQRQRLSIARALIPQPELIIADEATSMLDLHSGLEIADVFKSINQTRGTAFIIISHQLDIIKQACSEVAVMHNGRVAEFGRTESLLRTAQDQYVRELMQAMEFFSGGDL